jgi:hypothetical protein
MRRSLAIGIVGGCVWLQLACGSGVLSGGGDAGPPAGAAGAGGRINPIGLGGSGVVGGQGGVAGWGSGGAPSDPFSACARPMPAVPVPPSLVIALDTSPAMNDLPCAGCDSMSRWANATRAINQGVEATQQDVRWGLELIGDATNACPAADGLDVLPALGTAPSIAAALGARTDAGGGLIGPGNRPTRGAVFVATQQLMLQALQTDSGRGFMVLLTAGAPSCAANATDATTDDTAATAKAIGDAFSAGYGTFVVGLGVFDAATDERLQQMASAGNPNLTGPVPNLYTTVASDDVTTVLRSLAHYTSGCTFEVPPPPNSLADRGSIAVFWGDVQISRDRSHSNGWDYTDATMRALQLHGPACDLVRTDRTQSPVIRFFCPLI